MTKVKIKDITIEIAKKHSESELKCWEKDFKKLLLKMDTRK
jgi:hypothetical protein